MKKEGIIITPLNQPKFMWMEIILPTAFVKLAN